MGLALEGNVCWGFRTIESGRKEKSKYMAELVNKYPQNAAGSFYVDDQCIDCDLCWETAPANFTRNDDGGHSYVYKQPESHTLLRLFEPHPPMPQMRTFLRLFLFPTDAYRCPLRRLVE